MNGIHDMGGMHGFGAVDAADTALFHADWEKRIFALNAAIGGLRLWNIDKSRSMMESLPPDVYLSRTYFERWVERLERAVVLHDLVTPEEIAVGHSLQAPRPGTVAWPAAAVPEALARGASTERPEQAPARFKVGDRVRAKEMNPATHTRSPRYVRGKAGTVVRVHGVHVFPDAVVLGRGEEPQWLYAVQFEATALWGEGADPHSDVVLDAWEPYLDMPQAT